MANVRNVNDFVEQLSNCIGEISGDEVVFKKIPYSSEYVVRMRNHNEKVANIWYDYDKDKIIVQLVPAFRNMEYSIDDLTIDTIKGIGQMVKKNALNRRGESMEIKEAKQILKENGYLIESEEKPLFAGNERLSYNNRWLEEYNFACDKINTFTVGDREVIDANEAREAFKEMAKSIADLEKMIYMRNH